MKTNLEMKNLESQVIECYSYFMNNYQNTNFDALEDRPPLHKGTKCDMRFKSSLNSARLNLLNPYK